MFFTQYSDKKYVCYSNYLAKRFKQYLKKNALFNNKDIGILVTVYRKGIAESVYFISYNYTLFLP